jgi:nucleotide-binding universal stress UspA family protein
MYKHILIPVQLDDSRDVAAATSVALRLTSSDGHVSFLHAIEPVPAFAESYVPDIRMTENRTFAQTHLEKLAKDIPDAHIALTDGAPGRAITDWAEANDVDCIVIASHQPAFSDVFLGSTAAWVVRHAKCPVHVVR